MYKFWYTEMDYKPLISSKIFIAALLILLVFLGNIKYKQYKSQSEILKEKDSLTKQAETLQKNSQDLNNSLSYLNSQNYKDRIARQQLNLKKNGETVYNFSYSSIPTSTINSTGQGSNPSKWWKFFFQSN